jgi:hypothetical protein
VGKDVPEELRQCHPVVKKLRDLGIFLRKMRE